MEGGEREAELKVERGRKRATKSRFGEKGEKGRQQVRLCATTLSAYVVGSAVSVSGFPMAQTAVEDEGNGVLVSDGVPVGNKSPEEKGDPGKTEEITHSPLEVLASAQILDKVDKPSWTKIVQRESVLARHTFSYKEIEGNQVVEIPDELIEESVPLWEDFLIGKFLSTAPHVAKVHVIVNKIWTLGDKTIKIDAYEVNETTI